MLVRISIGLDILAINLELDDQFSRFIFPNQYIAHQSLCLRQLIVVDDSEWSGSRPITERSLGEQCSQQ